MEGMVKRDKEKMLGVMEGMVRGRGEGGKWEDVARFDQPASST